MGSQLLKLFVRRTAGCALALCIVLACPLPAQTSFEEISQVVTQIVSSISVREFALCELHAALWGGYNVTVRVSQARTSDGQPRIFRITNGVFTHEVDPNGISQPALAERDGTVVIATKEEAFSKGVPFFVADPAFETPTHLTYTVHSNPGVTIDRAFGRVMMIGTFTTLEIVDTPHPISSSAQPQPGFFDLNSPLDGSRKSYFSIVTTGNDIRCLVSNEIRLESLLADQPPSFTAAGVVNAASYASGGVSPGEILTLFGSRMGPAMLTGLTVTGGKVDSLLAETRVLFDGIAAPLVYVWDKQVSAVAPYEIAGKESTQVEVEYRGKRSASVSIPVVPAKPGIFALDATGQGPGAILNQNFSVNSADNPESIGNVVQIFATGAGLMDPAVPNGTLVGLPLPRVRLPVSVRIGGIDVLDVQYAGGAPTLVAGVLQVNAKIPAGVTPGNVPVVIIIGGVESQANLTVAVK